MNYIIIAAITAIVSILFTILILSPKLKRIKYDNEKIEQENIDLKENNNNLLQEKDQILKEIDTISYEKVNILKDIDHLVKEQDIHKNNLETLKAQATQSANIFYEQAMKIAEQRLDADLALEERAFGDAQGKAQDEYLQTLEDCVNSFQIQIDERRMKIIELDAELADLKAKTDAVIEAAKRQEELESKIDYYRLQIPEEDKREIQAILSIKPLIRQPRILYMLIWTTYYRTKANELAVRVLGNKEVCGIYRITNIQTQQAYIGQARDIKDRFVEHIKCSLGIDTPGHNKLYTNTMKYGIDNFTFELLEQCPVDELDIKEKYWISFYDTYNNGLNSNRGNNKKGE